MIPLSRPFSLSPFYLITALSLYFCTSVPVRLHAQSPLPSPAKDQAQQPAVPAEENLLPDIKAVKEQRNLTQETLKSLQKQPVLYKDQIALLGDLDAALARQEEALTVRDYLETEKGSLTKISGLPMEAQINEKFTKPYDLGKLDSLYKENESLAEEMDLAQEASIQSDALLNQNQGAFEKSEAARRLAQESVNPNSLPTSVVGLQSRVDLATLRYSKINILNGRVKKENLQAHLKILQPQILYVQKNLKLTDALWREIKQGYDRKEIAIKESLDAARNAFATTQKNLAELGPPSPSASPAKKARIEALQTTNLAAQRRAILNETWLEQLTLTRDIMRFRFDLYENRAHVSDKKSWALKADETVERLEPQLDYLTTSMEGAQKKLETLKSKSREMTDKEAQAWTETAIRQQDDLIACYQEEIWSHKTTLQLCKRLQFELNAGKTPFSLDEIGDSTWGYAKAIWYTEIFKLEDRGFRVSTLFWVLLWLGVGFLVAWAFSTLVGKAILRRYGVPGGVASAYQKLLYYIILVVFCVSIFEYFHISLTSLTIVSGALALGVGFGSQDIIKNFISGLILLFERPVNEGDTIQIEGDVVKVEHIGPRSTRVKAIDNTQRIIPNNRLLENIIVNWTLSDSVIRSSILVGVAYGSPTRKVVELLIHAVESIDEVLKEPKTEVFFLDFGDNALVFKVLFSTASDRRYPITTEARHRIYEELEKAGIAIAFPQRDVHLDSNKPLEFRMISESGNPKPADEASS